IPVEVPWNEVVPPLEICRLNPLAPAGDAVATLSTETPASSKADISPPMILLRINQPPRTRANHDRVSATWDGRKLLPDAYPPSPLEPCVTGTARNRLSPWPAGTSGRKPANATAALSRDATRLASGRHGPTPPGRLGPCVRALAAVRLPAHPEGAQRREP